LRTFLFARLSGFLLLSVLLMVVFPGRAFSQRELVRYVNTFVGTGGHGHTYPGATVPFGMVQLSPDTRVEGWDACSGYHYSDSTILGFTHTHISGTGVADYGDILLMPTIGPPAVSHGDPARRHSGYRSAFRHQTEQATPGYYSVQLDDYDIRAELTASTRVGLHRYTFPRSNEANVILDLQHGLGPDHVIEAGIQISGDNEIAGYRRSDGWAKDQMIYFVVQFSKSFRSFGISVRDRFQARRRMASGRNVKAYVRFSTGKDEQVLVKVGISAVDIDGARRNLATEVPDWDFDAVRGSAQQAWEAELSKIQVDGATEEQYRTFYTALYHVLLAPNTFSDVDGRFRGMDGKIHEAKGYTMYTVFSLWDTFRAEHPLLTIIDPKRSLDFVKSLIEKYEESRVLPVWELAANETWCMIGYHSVPVIFDAYVKGIRGFDASEAFQAMKHSAMLYHFGLQGYRQEGFVPAEKESESVSKTLEYAYDDWCIAQMAGDLGKREEYDEFAERAQFYKNVFDPSTGFMRAKYNASWAAPFEPASVNVNYTEANAWQYSFFVPQDVPGLITLLGGRERFVQKLDSLFTTTSKLAGRDQPDVTGLIGQYAHGNEPSHHVAYLYDYAGKPWKTQAMVRFIVDSLYSSRPDGLCGNDDCGQMSAWYVLSAMGFYPVTPGLPMYAIGSPIFKKMTIRLENGKEFILQADGNSAQNKYVQSARLNGKSYGRCYLTHETITEGGGIEFSMGPRPNTSWGAATHDAPPSLPLKPIVSVPYVVAPAQSFTDSLRIELRCDVTGAEIYYSIAGRGVESPSTRYSVPFVLKDSATVHAYAKREPLTPSRVISATFTKFKPIGTIRLDTRYSAQYTAGGDRALIDGRRGTTDFRVGAWQGYEGNDLDDVVDLGSRKVISAVSLGCLQDNNSWIFFPTQVEFSFSDDGSTFRDAVIVKNDVSPRDQTVMIKEFSRVLEGVQARFVRVRAMNIGVCPDWHKGAGSKAWLFVDEITVNER
jgi:predicted alpha-1,2-mannosidase